MNELDQNNVYNNDDDDDIDNDNDAKGQNQGGNNNNHAETSDDEASYNDLNINDNNLNDNQQHNYDSTGNWDNEPNVEESEDDNDCDPNDINQDKEAVTIQRRNHNMDTQQNSTSNIGPGLPSANNRTGFNGPH